MIGILILIGIAAGFYNQAKKLGLKAGLWAFLALVAWFGGQILAILIVMLVAPRDADNYGVMLGAGLGGSVVGIIILYFIMKRIANNLNSKSTIISDEIMDDTFMEDL